MHGHEPCCLYYRTRAAPCQALSQRKANPPACFCAKSPFSPTSSPLPLRRAAPKGGEAALFGPASLARAGAAWYNPRSGEKPRSDRDLFFAIVNRGIWVQIPREAVTVKRSADVSGGPEVRKPARTVSGRRCCASAAHTVLCCTENRGTRSKCSGHGVSLPSSLFLCAISEGP